MKEPQFLDSGVKFTVILPRHTLLSEEDLEWLETLPHNGQLSDIQRQILVAMRRGQAWTNEKVRKEFGPLDSLDARTLLQELVSLGLVEATGAGRWTEYRMKKQWGNQTDEPGQLAIDFEASDAFHPEPPAAQSTPVDPTDPNSSDAERRAAATSKHGKILWNALREGPKNARELSEATELGIAQVRYGMKRLVSAGLVHRSGGQGYRQTTYSIL